MDAEDIDFKLVRKNLNILSVLILVLAFTDAKLSSMNILGLSITLNPHKFYIILYVGYTYFLWRFLTKVPIQSGFMSGFRDYYLNGINGVQSKYNYVTLYKAFEQTPTFIRYSDEVKGQKFNLLQMRVVQLGTSIAKLRLTAKLHSSIPISIEGNTFTTDIDISIPWRFYIRKLFWYSVRHDKFGDYLFPMIPVFINFLMFFLKSDWQGGFKSILS